MSEKQRAHLTRWVDIIYKLAVPLGLAALFFLRASFVTKPELEAVSTQVREIQRTLAVMAEQNRTNERQDKRMDDHEARLRALELNR